MFVPSATNLVVTLTPTPAPGSPHRPVPLAADPLICDMQSACLPFLPIYSRTRYMISALRMLLVVPRTFPMYLDAWMRTSAMSGFSGRVSIGKFAHLTALPSSSRNASLSCARTRNSGHAAIRQHQPCRPFWWPQGPQANPAHC
ncbi:hypothetical protein CC85DRAFT_142812 [Cutaneotrichosporon oleaginosum]|uniref:Uncharacterized protein n=1 Tax=Cutaneotrichosporon oleaginosum TaxID=879819 RepID=A0A0J0XI54_9TREE|nr:uncharacterized protein CC85DRAFT_142812 [Cutaneotrichosporon oleaginosum]KLT40758.1 hypothetical protein CC85DRAFT_142812 [Cutaneotrichosporon oleaginosum]TXT06786.1 hypothetical protein COLE_06117 [Cutaneotrichosporon oleaginosum]